MMTDQTMTDRPEQTVPTTDDSFLSGRVMVRQPRDGYRVGTDAVMLAASIAGGRQMGRALDMGAGVGGVSLAVSQRLPDMHITAVEQDQLCCDLLRYNSVANGRDSVIRPYKGDVLALPAVLKGSFDQVFANPPFHHGSDAPSRSRRRAQAHYADEQALARWVASGLWALRQKGRLTVIVRADRTDQVMRALYEGGAGEMLLHPIWSYRGSPAIRMIITARKGVKGAMALLPGLVLHHPGGALTPEARRVMKGEALLLRHPATAHLQG